jgi:myosin-5
VHITNDTQSRPYDIWCRLETNLSSLESENQVLRQQSLLASADDDKSKQIESLESKIAILESENQLLRSKSSVAVQAVITPEVIQPSAMEGLVNRYQLEEHKILIEEVVVPPIKNLSKQKSLTDRQQVCFSAFKIFLYQCKKQVPRS